MGPKREHNSITADSPSFFSCTFFTFSTSFSSHSSSVGWEQFRKHKKSLVEEKIALKGRDR